MKVLFWVLGVLLAIYIATLGALYFAQESLIFLDEELETNYAFEFNSDFEEINIETTDGAVLNAIHFKVKEPKGIIVYFHGNAGNLSRWGKIAEQYLAYQQNVLIVDYRGYGKSRGKRGSELMYQDALQVYDEAKKWFPENTISVYGRSLGCTFAVYAASKNKPKQLLLETPFYSLNSVVESRYPFLPSKRLMNFQFPTYEFIQEVKCPITIFHGTEDFVVPYQNGKRLHELIPNAEFITIPEGEHNDLGEYDLYWERIGMLLSF